MEKTVHSRQHGQIKVHYLGAKDFHTGQSMYVYRLGFVNVMQRLTDKIRRVELIIHCPIKHPKKMQSPDKRTSRRLDYFIGSMLMNQTIYSPQSTGNVLFILK